MKHYKKTKIFVSIITLGIVAYLVCSITFLNDKETYYGVVKGNKHTLDEIINENGQTIDSFKLDKSLSKDLNNGDTVKITFTDNKGVVLNQEKCELSQIPSSIKSSL